MEDRKIRNKERILAAARKMVIFMSRRINKHRKHNQVKVNQIRIVPKSKRSLA